MAKVLTANFSIRLSPTYTDATAFDSELGTFAYLLTQTSAAGAAATAADIMFADRRTLTATSEDLDLAGILTDAYKDVLTYAVVCGFLVRNRSTTTTEILAVGGAAANQFINWVGNSSDIVNVGPNGFMFLWSPVDGYAVTAGTGDLLKIDAGADTIIYDIIVIGTSA